MKKRVEHEWHDEWITEHLLEYGSYFEAAKAYRETFGVDICQAALKNHCRYKLGIAKPRGPNYRHPTEEQITWLKEIYPKTGVAETRRLWNERYADDLSTTCIKQIAKKHDITVDPTIATANKLKAAHGDTSKRALRKPGDTRMECGRLVMKDDNGAWKSAGRCVWEKFYGVIPDGYVVVALDGDTTNVDLDNLEIVPLRYLGKLQRNDFFSENPEITRAGIIWCDLYTALSKEERNIRIGGD